MATAERNNSPVLLANDPDADRLAVAERLSGGEWRVFNGNEIGILFASWIWGCFIKANPSADRSKCAMVSTAVSSKMIKAMADEPWIDGVYLWKWPSYMDFSNEYNKDFTPCGKLAEKTISNWFLNSNN